MSTTPGEAGSVAANRATQGLRRDALGLLGSTMLGVVILGPSLAVYFSWGFMIPSVGRATAVVFALAMLMSLPTAYSYARINSRSPSAGATYTWASRLINPRVGITMGLVTTLFYACIVAAEIPFIAVIASDLVQSTSTTTIAVLMAATVLLAIPFIYRGITFSIETAAVLVAIELIIVIVIAVGAFIASDDSQASIAPLDPGEIPGTSALIPALILGIVSFTGYDAISTVAEETRSARRLIPKATIMAVVCAGVFWIVISTILSNALSPAQYTKVIDLGGFPLAGAAATAFGDAGRVVIDIMALEAAFGVLIAASVGSTRILYAMGRDGVIDRRFGTVHPRFNVPWVCISAVLAFAIVATALLAAYLGVGFNITIWLANLIVFLALANYLVINICNPLLFVREFRSEFRWFSNGVVPAAGVLVTGYFMYKGFFQVLWNGDFKMGRSIVITALALVAAAALASWTFTRRSEVREAAG